MSKEAMKLALDALDEFCELGAIIRPLEVRDALREALAEQPTAWVTAGQHTVPLVTQPAQKRPQNCGTSYCSCIECVMESAQQEQGDSSCQEDDGCPTELAVLQRFWRGQPIPDEHYPEWFKPAQQKPVAYMDEKKRIVYWHNTHDVDDYHGFKRTTPLYESPPKRTWVGLTKEEVYTIEANDEIDWAAGGTLAFARLIEAKIKDKNNG